MILNLCVIHSWQCHFATISHMMEIDECVFVVWDLPCLIGMSWRTLSAYITMCMMYNVQCMSATLCVKYIHVIHHCRHQLMGAGNVQYGSETFVS